MKLLALILTLALFAVSGAKAGPSPYGPIHIERQRGSILTIEHTPVPRRVGRRVHSSRALVKQRMRQGRVAMRRKVQRVRWARGRSEFVRHPAIAGGCREGGFVRRHIAGQGRVTLQREVCEGIAPVSSLPRGMLYVPQ